MSYVSLQYIERCCSSYKKGFNFENWKVEIWVGLVYLEEKSSKKPTLLSKLKIRCQESRGYSK